MGYREFLNTIDKSIDKIREFIDKGKNFNVFCHIDADGLSSGAITSVMLLRANTRFITRSVRNIEEIIEAIPNLPPDSIIILTDIGSGYLNILREKFREKSLIILDHHQPDGEVEEGWIHINPHLYNIDGAREISSSGVAYLVAKALSEENVTLSPIAVVGALGDLQDKSSEKRELDGLNKMIVEDAVKAGLIKVSDDLLFYGRSYRPLHLALASTTSPYIPTISGSEAHAVSFLNSLKIKLKEDDRWRVFAELDEEEKKTIYNGLMKYLSSINFPPSIVKELVGKVYELTKEEDWTPLKDAREFSSLLNACGKTGNEWIGIAVAMGSRGELLLQAQKILEEYRKKLSEIMEYLVKRDTWQELKYIIAIDVGTAIDDRMVSSASSILSSSELLPEDKPLIMLATRDDKVKVSARASRKLVAKGLNLGFVMKKAAERTGGVGGGHDVAAGAEIPLGKKTMFLAEADSIVGEFLKS
ncbi:MAG: DHH family phosphoesterase [Aigarchaeota archaeon]|nr:DHH family phosphoesterase [Aigarchaeota archaeon]MCX8193246.1 DHH family phosphoesterase [Nitrososphaeria archaeon]MDW7986386.1 DHH family phosphoesterase [Nitrososphaerota archaeon]